MKHAANNAPFAPRQFVVSDEKGGFVVVTEGQLGYFESKVNIPDQAEADRINRQVLGNSPAEVSAAKAASMFGWDRYEAILEWEKRKRS